MAFPTFTAGQKIRASDLNSLAPRYARYERNSGTQAAGSGANTQVNFPTAIAVDNDVVASGTSNNAFTLAAPTNWGVVWEVVVSLCLSAATVTTELSIATGSATWALANVKAAGGTGAIRVEAVCLVPIAAGSTDIVTINLYQASGGSINISAANFPSQISFKR
jgi:hypothetical protein